MPVKPRTLLALCCLAAGVVLAPFIPVASETVDWRSMADVYLPIFEDGFEDGTTDAWSVTVSGRRVTILFSHGSPTADGILRSIDHFGHGRVPTSLLTEAGLTGDWTPSQSTVEVDDCRIRIEQDGVVFSFSPPPR